MADDSKNSLPTLFGVDPEKLCKLLNNKKKTKAQCLPLIRELKIGRAHV